MSAATDTALLDHNKAKLDAETKAALALATLHKAQAKKAEAEANSATLDAAAKSVAVDEMLREQSRDAASDGRNHVYNFISDVSASSVTNAMRTLTEWSRLDPQCDIEIVFTSPGGSVYHGMALFDFICKLRRDGHKITTGALGYAASMGGILLQAGDVRWIGRESYLLIHEISASTGGKIGDMKDDVEFYKRVCARIVDIFIARSDGKITPAKFKAGWTRTDWWLTSDECERYGFVDEVR